MLGQTFEMLLFRISCDIHSELMQPDQAHAAKTFNPSCTCTYIFCPDFSHRKALVRVIHMTEGGEYK